MASGINYQSFNNYLSPSGGSDWSSLLNETQSLMNFGDPFGQSAQQTYNPSSQSFSYNVPGASASSPLGFNTSAPAIQTPQAAVPSLGASVSAPANSPVSLPATLPTPISSSTSSVLPGGQTTQAASQSPTVLPGGASPASYGGGAGGAPSIMGDSVQYASNANAPLSSEFSNIPNSNSDSTWTSAGQVWGDLIPQRDPNTGQTVLTGGYPSYAAYLQAQQNAYDANQATIASHPADFYNSDPNWWK